MNPTDKPIKLNLGSKHRKLEGFVNLDKLFGWRFQDGLGDYEQGCVDGITISHALMFLTIDELRVFMAEMWRVLRPGGVVRITEDDTENIDSSMYKTGCIPSGPACLTGPKMMRELLEETGFMVYDVDATKTHFYDNSLIQAYRGGPPLRFFIEGSKGPAMSPGCLALMKGLQKSGPKIQLLDCSRDNLPEFFSVMGYTIGAEVGVYKGAFTEKFCIAGLKMFAVDPWKAYQGAGRTQKEQDRQDFLYGHTQRTLAPYKDCTIIRADSTEGVKQFEDESLDFVYLDGDHSFAHIAADIVAWSKKVRRGGIIAGHDYFYFPPHRKNLICHVAPVVDAFVTVNEIPTLYIIGPDEHAAHKDNRYPSWMFFKHENY